MNEDEAICPRCGMVVHKNQLNSGLSYHMGQIIVVTIGVAVLILFVVGFGRLMKFLLEGLT